MRLFTTSLCAAVAGAVLAGCGGNLPSTNTALPAAGTASRPVSVVNGSMPPHGLVVLHSILNPDIAPKPNVIPRGLYVSEFYASDVYGYPAINKDNGGPTCTIGGIKYVNGLGVDGKANLMIPDGNTNYLRIYKGPAMCGKSIGAIDDSYGQPTDASSLDAVTGKIVISNAFDVSDKPGSISICTLKGGCTANLTNSAIDEAGGVALANNGDCWVSASGDSSGGGNPAIVYFKGCSGKGAVATGVENASYGGLDIDNKGNLISVDYGAEKLYVYSGCNPACKLVAGPQDLHGDSFFGKVNAGSTQYAMTNMGGGVDVYKYSSTKGIAYEYSFTQGLSASEIPLGIAYKPRSKQ